MSSCPIAQSSDSVSVNGSDSLVYDIARKVVFPVNKYTIDKKSAFSQELLNDILPYVNRNSYALTSLLVRGAASPEGPYEWNKTLSRLRTEALKSLISANIKRPMSSLNTVEIPEDYAFLPELMKQRCDADYKRVADIVNKYIDTDQAMLKKQLMAVDGGRLWRRLIREYFPQLRAASVVMHFRKRAYLDSLAHPKGMLFSRVVPPFGPLQLQAPMESRLPRRELLSVKTNLLLDFAYMPGGYDRFCPIPNVAIEYYPLHGHFTYGASIDFPWWQHYAEHKFFQIRNYQLETRYYLRSGDVNERGYGKAAFTGLYAQAYVHGGLYGICFDADRGWEGEGVGAGLGIGYVMPLTRSGHWRLELGAQFGAFVSKYDPYQYESPIYPDLHDNRYYYKWYKWGNLFKRRQHRFTWVGPTRVGVTLTYDLIYRKRTKKGVSLKRWETIR